MALTQQALDIKGYTTPCKLASEIGSRFQTWKSARSTWEKEKAELRNYVFATDTTKTTNKSLPWKNSTTQPKLTQIRDNLHANYISALFPHEDWFTWEPANEDAALATKSKAIKAYMTSKLKHSGFYRTISQLVYDYIDYGNAFADCSYVSQTHEGMDKSVFNVYQGPQAHRVSAMDIVFDITSASFKNAPKITRTLVALGTLQKEAQSNNQYAWALAAFTSAEMTRKNLGQYQADDINKYSGISVDGFGTYATYISSGMVELLEFEGDIYDSDTNQLYVGHRIIVVDRKDVVHKEPFPSWLGTSSKEHVAWRLRPDNLMGMGPLDNLVGMQYRIDHLENLKADVFDQIAHPVVYKRGYVEDFTWGPGQQVNGDTESEVRMLVPDTTALNADFQIQNLMNVMEEMAGAPKQAMGIRTPGEKTAFEVQSLDNAAGRIFQAKVAWFEMELIEPLLNQMLEQARRNLDVTDVVQIIDDDFGVAEFMAITKEDLQSKGRVVPMGSRHFARQNQLAQNLLGLVNSAAYQDPMVQAHISSIGLAKALEELLDFEKFGLVIPNIRVAEQMELSQAQTSSQQIQVDELAAANQADQVMEEDNGP
jgi:hypothetical protein